MFTVAEILAFLAVILAICLILGLGAMVRTSGNYDRLIEEEERQRLAH